MNDPEESEQEKTWGLLYDQIQQVLQGYGTENPYGDGDYWVLDDNWGVWQHKVEVHSLKMLMPPVVKSLQSILAPHPNWDIVVAVDIPAKENLWPAMGLIIRKHEIVDGLQRQYFPKKFQSYEYEGSRRGTDRD
jgi:hypothetical protein